MEAILPDFNTSIAELNTALVKKEFETCEINRLLDKLNSMDYNVVTTDQEGIENAVHNCCKFIPLDNSFLVAKGSNFIFNMITQRSGAQLDQSLIVQWICNSLQNCADIAYMDILQLIDALIKVNYSNFHKHVDQLFSVLLNQLELNANVANPIDIKIMRISCLRSLAGILPHEKHLSLSKVYIDMLYTQGTGDLTYHAQVWAAVLEALDTLCTKSTEWLEEQLNEIIGIVLYGIELGLNGKIPSDPRSSAICSSIIPPPQKNLETTKVKVKVTKKQKSKVKQVGWSEKHMVEVAIEEDKINYEYFNTNWITSDSDVSDSEGNQRAIICKSHAKVRHSSFNLLIQIIKVLGCKLLYEYYSIILGKLITCVKNETLSKPKIAAMASITALLAGAKPFLAQAQHNEGGAFTTFSEVLSELLTGLHTTLGGILSLMPHRSVAIPLLHTVSALISVTPYHRLRPTLLTNIFKAIYLHRNHKDATVSVGTLHCLSEIVILNPVTNEQKDIILYGINNGTKMDGSWIISHCFSVLTEHTSSDVRVACWQILGGLSQCHFEVVIPSLSILERFIFQDLNATDKPMIYAAKTMEHLLSQLILKDEFDTYRRDLWMKLLEGPFVSLIDNTRRVAAIACDCLSSIGPQVFNSLEESKQILIITLLYGCCYSESVVVRGSAVNTLGVFLLFPQLTHEQFVYDTRDTLIKLLSDESDYVRAKAAWAFGNLVDLLTENQDKEFVLDISVFKLLEAALLVTSDNNKVKTNILRAIGNLLLLVDEEQLKIDRKDIIEKAVTFCISSLNSGTMMKMRWNACYALGTLLQNEALYRFSNKWLGAVISSLCNLLVKCNNFKVRANACSALCSIKKREYFGVYYNHIWLALFDGLDNAANMTDFKEFKHQDHLVQQLCTAICHLTSILQLEDVDGLSIITHCRLDAVKQKMLQFQNSAPPEKSGTLLSALNNINNLLKLNIESNQKRFLLIFQKVFIIV